MNKNYSNSKLTIAIRKSLFHPFVLGGVLCLVVLCVGDFYVFSCYSGVIGSNFGVVLIWR